EVNIFKNALARVRAVLALQMIGFNLRFTVSIQVDDHHLAGFYITNVFCANNIKGTGFAGYTITAVYLAQCQRSKPIWVSYGNEFIISKQYQAVGSFNLPKGIQDLLNLCLFPALGYKMKN